MSSRTKAPIDEQYFRHYAGRRSKYQKIWKDHSSIDICLAQFQAPGAPRLKSICVLGTATGEILIEFDKGLGLRPYGCEISNWAFKQIPLPYRHRIRQEDMQKFIADTQRRGKVFDLIYSNSSLVYLDKKELPAFLRSLARTCRFFHFSSSFKGAACPDPYRKILESYDWWSRRLRRAGFSELKTAKGKRTYLWRSNKSLTAQSK